MVSTVGLPSLSLLVNSDILVWLLNETAIIATASAMRKKRGVDSVIVDRNWGGG